MTVRNWAANYGVWNAGTNWNGGVAPGPGDVAIINGPNAEPDLGNLGTLVDQTINVLDGFKLDIAGTLGPTSFDADTSLNLLNSGTFVVADAGIFTNNGYIGALGAGVDWYLIPGGPVTSALINNGTLNVGAPFRFMGFGDLLNGGLIEVRNFAGAPGVQLTLASPTQFLSNNGTLSVDGVSAGSPTDTGATLNTVGGAGTITLRNGTITIKGNVGSNQALQFLDDKGSLSLDLGGHSFSGVISGFRAGDTIDLGIPSAGSIDFFPGSGGTPGILTVYDSGSPVALLQIAGDYHLGDFSLSLNGLGHEALTTTAAPCFATGSRLLTAAGEVAVEALRVGDLLPTRSGRLAAIAWIGHRTLDCRRHARPQDVLPVRVTEGAFGPGMPHRDLLLSPDHAVHLEPGMLVPVRYLVNGATIRQEPAGRITYWHVELDRHEVIMAEGLAVESYLDTGNRGAFANGGGAAQLHPDFARGMWEAAGCAPLVVAGPALAAARAALLDRAEALGHGRSLDAAPCLLADGRPVAGRKAGGGLEFDLPAGARRAVLRSRTACPAEITAEAADCRRLGVAVAAVALDGAALALDDARLGAGWHAPEPGLRWTGGAAAIDVAGTRVLALRLLPLLRYWVTAPRGGRDASAAP